MTGFPTIKRAEIKVYSSFSKSFAYDTKQKSVSVKGLLEERLSRAVWARALAKALENWEELKIREAKLANDLKDIQGRYVTSLEEHNAIQQVVELLQGSETFDEILNVLNELEAQAERDEK